jgi:filamentous hemagglutinin
MIWKSLGFQLAAVVAGMALVVFLAPLPGVHESAQSPAVQAGSAMQPEQRPDSELSNTQETLQTPAGDSGVAGQSEATAGPVWSGGPEHDAEENAAHHWQKHRSEFREMHSESDYTNAAHDFIDHPPPGAQIKHDSRGNTLIYDPESNTFAVQAPDGAPRTMFRPHNGRAYWERQQ